MLIKADEIVVVPLRVRHGLVAVIEDGLPERIAVPFKTGHFTRLTADTSGYVDQFADAVCVVSFSVPAGDRTRMAGNCSDFECFCRHREILRPSPASPKSP